MADELHAPHAPDLGTTPGLHADHVDGLREVKVKLPADQVLRLHYARLKDGQNFSQTVSSALTRYFDALRQP